MEIISKALLESRVSNMIFLRFDPFGDSRVSYILGSNAFGSQVDIRAKNGTSDSDSFDNGYNAVFETKSSKKITVLHSLIYITK